jgi:hypothetical protein
MTLSQSLRLVAYATVVVACGFVLRRMAADPHLLSLAPERFDWGSLAAAVVVCTMSQLLYFERWYWIIRAMQAPLSRPEALATASLAQLLSSLAFGGAAGDVYRGVVTGRGRVGHRMAIVTSILADRLTGLYGLVCLAAIAATMTPHDGRWDAVRDTSLPILWLAVGGGAACIALGLVVDPLPLLGWTRSVPGVRRIADSLLEAAARYRRQPLPFLFSIVAGAAVHVLNAAVLWLVAGGLGLPRPSLAEHFLIMPLATCTGLLPLPLAGLGAMELVVEELYQAAVPAATGGGAIASVGVRLVSIVTNLMLTAILALGRRTGYTPKLEAADVASTEAGADS